MRYLLAGGSGFLGMALRVRLATEGHEVVRLVRRQPAMAREFGWYPDSGGLDREALEGVDVVVNLCGAGVADRPWTKSRRELLLSSRVDPGRTLARALSELDAPPVLVQASGIAVYGTATAQAPHTEDSSPGDDFLSQVVLAWEGSAQAAVDSGVRVAFLRTSPVLHRSGGAFRPMQLAWSAGLAAKLGDGQQHMAMLSLRDYLRVVEWVVDTPTAAGAYNLTIPVPATNAEFTAVLAEELHRPALFRAPATVIRAALGELAEQLLGDIHAVPERLSEQGFSFSDPDVRSTVRAALASL
jgi:uncharacterized protein (TIGR01777 family)